MIQEVTHDDRVLAIIISANYYSEGIEFFTPSDFSQQLGYMNRPLGYVIPPHVHNPVPREVQFTKEVLFIRSGSVNPWFWYCLATETTNRKFALVNFSNAL